MSSTQRSVVAEESERLIGLPSRCALRYSPSGRPGRAHVRARTKMRIVQENAAPAARIRVPVPDSPRSARLKASVICVTGSTATKSRSGGAYTTRNPAARSAAIPMSNGQAGSESVAAPFQSAKTLSIVVVAARRQQPAAPCRRDRDAADRQLRRVVFPVGVRVEIRARSSPSAGRRDEIRARTETARRRCWRARASRSASRRCGRPRARTTASRGTATATRAPRRRLPCARVPAARLPRRARRRATAAASRRRGSRADGRRSCARARRRGPPRRDARSRFGSNRGRADSRRGRGHRRRRAPRAASGAGRRCRRT